MRFTPWGWLSRRISLNAAPHGVVHEIATGCWRAVAAISNGGPAHHAIKRPARRASAVSGEAGAARAGIVASTAGRLAGGPLASGERVMARIKVGADGIGNRAVIGDQDQLAAHRAKDRASFISPHFFKRASALLVYPSEMPAQSSRTSCASPKSRTYDSAMRERRSA